MSLIFYAAVAAAPKGAALWVFVSAVFCGIGWSAISQLPRAMLADINDEELLEHGADRTGLLYAILTGVYKIGTALAVGVAFFALSFVGFVASKGAGNSPEALHGVLWMFSGLSALLTAAGLGLI